MSIPYEVIEQKEILREAYAGLMADISRLLDENPGNERLQQLKESVPAIWHNITGDEYQTMEDMARVRRIYQAVADYLKELEQ